VVRNRIAAYSREETAAKTARGENNAEYRTRAIILPDGLKVKAMDALP